MTEDVKEPKKGKRKGAGALFIPGGLFIGMGIGFATGNLVAWLFIGLGVGFLLFAVIMLMIKE
jgi:predicted histidine transporter YuiF (NhaC family)